MGASSSGMEEITIGIKIPKQKPANQYPDTEKSTNVSPSTYSKN
jgi:hypothetical protein